VLHLSRHHRASHPGGLEQTDALAELTERNPVNRRPVPRRGVDKLGKSLFLDGDHRHVMPLRGRRLEDQEGKLAVAGDETELHVPGSTFQVPGSCSPSGFEFRIPDCPFRGDVAALHRRPRESSQAEP
jgi:hypothetical protein